MDNQIRALSKMNSKRRLLKRGISLLCAVVLLITSNSLKMSADALEHIPMCGFAEEHEHTISCYDGDMLVCAKDEHVHTDACYQQRPDAVAIEAFEESISEIEGDLEDLADEITLPEAYGTMSGEGFVQEEDVPMSTGEPIAAEQTGVFSLGNEALVSRIIEAMTLDVDMTEILEVGVVENENLQTGLIAIERLEDDYRVWAQQDFKKAELALITADDILIVKLVDGVGIVPEQEGEPAPVEDVQDEAVSTEQSVAEEAAPVEDAQDDQQTEEETPVETEEQPVDETVLAETEERDGEAQVEEQPAKEASETEGQPIEDEAEEQDGEEQAVEDEAGEQDGEEQDVEDEAEEQDDEEQPAEEENEQTAEQPEQIIYTATIDLAEVDEYPLSLNALLAMAAPVEGEPAGEEIASDEAVDEETTPEWTIEYDQELLEIIATDDDYLVTPIADFDSTQIIVSNGSRYELTLVNCVLVHEEQEEEQITYPAQGFEAHTDYVKVSVSAPEGAFPEGTTMAVKDVEDVQVLTDIEETVSEDFVAVKRIHAVDISFWFNDAEIEPLRPISVVMSVEEIEQQQDAVVVHVDDEGETEVVEQSQEFAAAQPGETELTVEMPAAEVQTAAVEEDEMALAEDEAATAEESVAFSADSFSVYAVVVTETIETRYIDASGETWNITVGYGADAGIPSGATLAVSEVDSDEYLPQAEAALDGGKRVTMARFFDIAILDGEGIEVQPEQPVYVNITLDNAEPPEFEKTDGHIVDNGGAEAVAMHFAADASVAQTVATIEAQEAIAFEAEGFSVWGVVYTVDFYYGNYEYHLDGGAYMSLARLAEALEIAEDGQAFANGVETVAFSAPDLLSVSRVDADATVADIKAALALECEYSGALTAEQLAEIDATPVAAGDWALISVKAFETREALSNY